MGMLFSVSRISIGWFDWCVILGGEAWVVRARVELSFCVR